MTPGAQSPPKTRRVARVLAARDPRHRARTRWLQHDGVAFLRSAGCAAGHAVLDFGCGGGAWSLPAARLVGDRGLVIAVDTKEAALREVARAAAANGCHNVQTAPDLAGAIKTLGGRRFDAVLFHDVLQFFDAGERGRLYAACRPLLRDGGTLSVIPAHLGGGHHRARHFAALSVDQLVLEIEKAGYRLVHRGEASVWHGGSRQLETVLRFAARAEGDAGRP